MFRTPNLKTFMVTWYVTASNLPQPLNNEDFLAERFIEDVMDGQQSIALCVEEVHLPMSHFARMAGEDVAVRFKIRTTEAQARELIELGYRVRPEHPDQMETIWDDPDDGMLWRELLACVNGPMRPFGATLDKPIRATDDGDPAAPWFKVTGIKTDDDGPFLSIEVIEP